MIWLLYVRFCESRVGADSTNLKSTEQRRQALWSKAEGLTAPSILYKCPTVGRLSCWSLTILMCDWPRSRYCVCAWSHYCVNRMEDCSVECIRDTLSRNIVERCRKLIWKLHLVSELKVALKKIWYNSRRSQLIKLLPTKCVPRALEQ